MASLTTTSTTTASFKYLYIPHDETKDIQQLSLTYEKDNEIGCFTQCLSKHFVLITGAKTISESNDATFQLMKAEAKKKGIDIDDADKTKILQQLSQSQMVDIVPLQMARKNNEWISVSMYVDDKGVNKGVPMNVRATKLSMACGRPVRVMGDAFVARAQDDNRDLYQRMDISKEEFSPNATWVVESNAAVNQKKASGSSGGGGSGGSGGSGSNSVPLGSKKKKVSTDKLEKYAEQLVAWVESKLKQFDEEEKFREERISKYQDRAGFELYLRNKVKKKIASFAQ